MHLIVIKHLTLFIYVGKEIQSNEGTTQDNPVVMGMHATRTFPWLHLNVSSNNKMNEKTKCLAFAHDFIGAGKLQKLRSW